MYGWYMPDKVRNIDMLQLSKAFAFDIDGVLIRGGKVLPGAKKALELLNDQKIPWIVVTNGGGMLERDRCADLSSKIGVPVSTDQFLQSHTPFRDFVGEYDRILAIGGKQDSVKKIALSYGFPDVVVTKDIVAALPDINPFPSWTQSLIGHTSQASQKLIDTAKPFDAIFCFHDTYDMTTDAQIAIDLLLSQNGMLGTRKEPHEYEAESSIPIYFSNADLQWATDFKLARFGQGAFIHTLESLYTAVTEGKKLTHTTIGKPTALTYMYAEKLLHNWAKEHGKKLEKVYMIGDNQYSDIRGANSHGWESVLVRSGVYKDGDDLFTNPTFIEDNVLEGVERALSA